MSNLKSESSPQPKKPMPVTRWDRLLGTRRNAVYLGVCAVVLVVMLILPRMSLSGFVLTSLTTALLLAVRAQAWNFIGGYTGYAAFGNVAFYGLGAYGTAILMTRLHWPFFLAMLAGGLIATVYAVIVGLPVLRMRGQYFAIATLGVAEATRELVSSPQLSRLTAGPTGINLPFFRPEGLSGAAAAEAGNVFFYYVAMGLVVVVVLATWLLTRSKLGYSLVAIREDEEAAKMLGINTTWAKVAAFALSAFFTGLVGGHYAYWRTFILPEEVFNVRYTLEGILSAVLGGPGTILGPVVGGGIYDAVSTFLTFSKPFGIDLGQFHVTILGVFIVMVIIFLPRGVADFFGRRKLSWGMFLENVRQNRV
jgi:branched-chain amino acid transport system permease protein